MTFEIGTISHGTLRTEDLLETFAFALSGFGPTEVERSLIGSAERMSAIMEEDNEVSQNEIEEAGEILNELVDSLNDHAPPYCYFGASEGDGSDFGFWPAIESLEEDARYSDDVLKVSDCSEIPGHVMLVSDHGNVTLFQVTLTEEWSCV